MTIVTKLYKCDKMRQVGINMSVIKCDKCDKTWQVWQNMRGLQEWQNVISVTEHDKCDKTKYVWKHICKKTCKLL